jgi:hypothetical protein
MTGPELAAIRQRLGYTAEQFGRALGYEGERNTVQVAVSRLESGTRDVPTTLGRLAEMFRRHGVPAEW